MKLGNAKSLKFNSELLYIHFFELDNYRFAICFGGGAAPPVDGNPYFTVSKSALPILECISSLQHVLRVNGHKDLSPDS